MPERIQRKRTKGWRMPAGAVYVGRPTRWGNPYAVDGECVFDLNSDQWWTADGEQDARRFAVEKFRAWFTGSIQRTEDAIYDLRGRDLMCWCPLDQPCHADVLLEIANGDADQGGYGEVAG